MSTDGGAFNYWLSTSAQGAPGASSYDFGAITLQNITHAGLAIFDQRIDDAHPIGSTNVNVRGDLNVVDNTTEIAFVVNAGELSIGGNVKVVNSNFRIGGTGTTTAPVSEWNGESWKKVTIAGGVDISGLKFTTAVTSGSDNNDFSKPDLSIGGVATMDSTSSWELNGNHSNRQDNVISAAGAFSVEIGAIPEPAALAAVFGALALALAAWRGRR